VTTTVIIAIELLYSGLDANNCYCSHSTNCCCSNRKPRCCLDWRGATCSL